MKIRKCSFETGIEYGAVCWDPYREGQVSALNRVQKTAAKFASNINDFDVLLTMHLSIILLTL